MEIQHSVPLPPLPPPTLLSPNGRSEPSAPAALLSPAPTLPTLAAQGGGSQGPQPKDAGRGPG